MQLTLDTIQTSISDYLAAADSLDELEAAEREQAEALILAELEALANAEAEKVDGYGMLFKSIEADMAFLKEEEGRIAAKRKALENRYGRVKDRLREVMEVHGIKKLAGRVHSVSLRPSTSVIVDCAADALPSLYRRHIPESWEADKRAIADALKAGIAVDGAHLETRTSVQIR